MSTCVQKQASIWKNKLKKGDILVSNHPMFGGTHLPDITVITPAFSGDNIVFYVASRAHHADIGGILPGSMPPHSRELYQEGAAIESEKLVSEGVFNEKRMTELLYDEPAQHEGCSGTRCLADNMNDLKAQIAANQKGINLITALIKDYGEEVVQFYMRNIQDNAELSVKNLLKDIHKRFEGQDLSAVDYMDDGSPIKLKITIDAEKGEAVFDFTGTGAEVYGVFLFLFLFSSPFSIPSQTQHIPPSTHASNHTNPTNAPKSKHKRPPRNNLLSNNLLPALPYQTRHPAEPRLPKTNPRTHPLRILPLAFPHSRSRRRQRPHLAARHRRRSQGLPSLRCQPGLLQ